MRYKFIILFLLIGFCSKAQVYQIMPQYGYTTFRMNFDSTIQIPTFCGVPRLGSNVTKKGALAFDSCNNRFYFFNPKSQSWDTIKSADASLFVKYTDTSSLLLPYLRKIDTTDKFVNSVIKINDTTIRVGKGSTLTDIVLPHPTSVLSAKRLITEVYNNTGTTIPKGSVVYISGRHSSNLATIALAQANNEANSYKTFALVENDIPTSNSGIVIQAGNIGNLNLPTSSYTDGDILYLSPTVPGGYTTTKPLAPFHICKLGSVTRAHPQFGSIEIKIENGWQLDELSDVSIPAVPADSVLLQFSRVDSLWHDVSPLVAIGNRYIKPSDTASMLTNYAKTSVVNTKLNISDTATMLSPYLRSNTAAASYVTSVFRKTASDSVFFVRGGSNNFAFRDSAGGSNIYNTDGALNATTRTLSYSNAVINTLENKLIFRNTSTSNNDFIFQSATNTAPVFQIWNPGTGGSLSFGGNGIVSFGGGRLNLQTSGHNITMTPSGTETARFATSGNLIIQTGGAVADISTGLLQLNSTTKGFLQPRLTTTQMNAISTPATGLSVFNTTDSSVYIRRGTGAGWQQVANEIFATASLNFPSTNAQNSSDLTITLTGAVDGDAVVLGVPNAAVNANSCYTAWVSAANTVTVRFNNYSSGAIDPAQATFKVTIIK
jgi:hypothetical protein